MTPAPIDVMVTISSHPYLPWDGGLSPSYLRRVPVRFGRKSAAEAGCGSEINRDAGDRIDD